MALKFQGIILWDFGGVGNCANFIDVIREKITDGKFTEYFRTFEWPWFVPSKVQYEELISSISFSDIHAKKLHKPRIIRDDLVLQKLRKTWLPCKAALIVSPSLSCYIVFNGTGYFEPQLAVGL